MLKIIFFALIVFFTTINSSAQCFSCFGNPAGGERILGVLEQNTLIITSFYSFSEFNKYFTGNNRYISDNLVLDRAYYNYLSLLAGYGIFQNLTFETEAGYYLNKTQVYNIENTKLSGSGLSNAVISLKHLLYQDFSNEIEISWGLGAQIPFSRELQKVDGVTLPIELQPSLGSYGIVFQSFIFKEDSFRARRYFFANRIERYLENNRNTIYGTFYDNALFFSKHLVFPDRTLSDWTFIIQLKNQIKARDVIDGETLNSSGNILFFFVPQININVDSKWNFSILTAIPLYQYYNGTQLGNSFSFGISVRREFSRF